MRKTYRFYEVKISSKLRCIMRILNTKETSRKYRIFSWPGFRSGSLAKKIVACIYYLSVIFFVVYSVWLTLSADFANGKDVFLTLVLEFIIVLIMMSPVIVIGFSDHYDWHGIKLVLIILLSWCVLFTMANYISTLFSPEFINSTNSGSSVGEVTSAGSSSVDDADPKIDDDIIIDNIDETKK